MKKQTILLGAFGALTVLGVNVASNINPTYAAEDGAEVTIKVTVLAPAPTGTITSIPDGTDIYDPNMSIAVNYTDASSIQYQLTYIDDEGNETTYTLPDHDVSTGGAVSSGTDEWTLDLSKYGGGKFGSYKLSTTINGNGSTQDTVTFKYGAFDIKDTLRYDEKTKNPIIGLTASPAVDHVAVNVYDSEGKSVFKDPQIVKIGRSMESEFTLDLASHGVPAGEYLVVATPYDASGTILTGNKSVTINYTPAPIVDVPKTGGTILSDLNLSNSDLVAAFMVMFAAALVGGAIFLKKTRRSSIK